MKHYIIYIVLIVSLIGALFLFIGGKKNGNESSVLPFVTKETVPIRLILEEGFVTWKKEGDAEYTRVTNEETVLPNNSYVKTADGRGYVILPDSSSISLNRNTEILVSYTPKSVSITQLLGTTYHRVMSLSGGSSYEVKTTGTLAAVRGTKFAVMYDEKNKKTNVVVTEHVVDVTALNETKQPTSESFRKVKEGETVTVKEEEIPSESGSAVKESEQIPKTASVAPSVEKEQPKARRFRMYIDSQKEKDSMKSWIEENKKIDEVFDTKRHKDQFIKDVVHEVRGEIKKEEDTSNQAPRAMVAPQDKKEDLRARSIDKALIILKNRKEISENAPNEKEQEAPLPPKTAEPKTAEPLNVGIKAPVINAPVVERTVQIPVLKEYNPNKEVLSTEEQTFIDTFYAAYEQYLYADEKGTACRNVDGLSAKDVLAKLQAITTKAGYILPRQDAILSLAQTIITACEQGTLLNDVPALETKFDVTYPYSG